MMWLDSGLSALGLLTQASLAKVTVTLGGASYAYNGKARKPAVTATLNGTTLAKGTDYKVAYADNVNSGTATVTVTGIGNYKGTAKATFEIVG